LANIINSKIMQQVNNLPLAAWPLLTNFYYGRNWLNWKNSTLRTLSKKNRVPNEGDWSIEISFDLI